MMSSKTSNIKNRTNSRYRLLFVVTLMFVWSRDFTGTYSHKRNHYLHRGTGLHTTYSMVLDIILEADCYSVFLWTPEDHYLAHKSPPLDPIRRHPNPVRLIDKYLSNVILPCTAGVPSGLFP